MNELYRYNRLRGCLSVVPSFAGAFNGGTMLLRVVLQWFNSYWVQYIAWIRYAAAFFGRMEDCLTCALDLCIQLYGHPSKHHHG